MPDKRDALALENIYKKTKFNKTSQEIETKRGVRHGYFMSLILFSIHLEEITKDCLNSTRK